MSQALSFSHVGVPVQGNHLTQIATTPASRRLPPLPSNSRLQPLTVVPTSAGIEQLQPRAVHRLKQYGSSVLVVVRLVVVRGMDRTSGIIGGADHATAIDGVPFLDKGSGAASVM